jgi:glucosylceramidase
VHVYHPCLGPFNPSPTMIQLNTETLRPEFRFEYYMYGQFTKFIRRGAIRVSSEDIVTGTALLNKAEPPASVNHIAFVNPDGTRSVVLVNDATESQTFRLEWQQTADDIQFVDVEMPGASVRTLTWTLA